MNIILFDAHEVRENLLPLSFTRPVAEFRVGITTIRQKWEKVLPGNYSYLTEDYLSKKYAMTLNESGENLFVAGHIVPDYSAEFKDALLTLQEGQEQNLHGAKPRQRRDRHRGAVHTCPRVRW